MADLHRVLIALWWGWIGGVGLLSAQVTLHSDADWTYPRTLVERPLNLRNGSPDTLPFSAAQPFFDDFAYAGALPDSNRWYRPTGELSTPQLMRQMPVNPPSRGAATFDGLDAQGQPYSVNSIQSGVADRLLSQHLDLSALQPGDSVMLSFYLQAQGRGEAPEPTDSFKVFFRTNLGGNQEYRQVFARAGGGSGGFLPVVIVLNDPAYFHAGFQLRFETIGSLNGQLDHWHLDYVLLAPNRQRSNAVSFNDQSITQLGNPLWEPYSAYPLHLLQQTSPDFFNSMALNLTNLSPSPTSVTARAQLRSLSGSDFSPPENLSVAPYAQPVSVVLGAPNAQTANDPGDFTLLAYLENHNDERPGNDSLRFTFPTDSVLAYDDGEPDAAFGLNKQRGFGMQVDLPARDSLVGVMIRFMPTVLLNQISGEVSYLEDHPFRVVMWNRPHPDSIFESQAAGMRVRYPSPDTPLVYYPFPAPVPVPTRFWLGLQQTDNQPIGVGYDRNFDRDSLTFFDNEGQWTNLSEGGALMIRPVFYQELALAGIEAQTQAETNLQLVPQPMQAGTEVRLHGFEAMPLGTYQGQLFQLDGRLIATFGPQDLGPNSELRLPPDLAPGLYLWLHRWQTTDGQWHRQAQKVRVIRDS